MKDTNVPNMAYITFIDGIILTPVAEKMNVYGDLQVYERTQ